MLRPRNGGSTIVAGEQRQRVSVSATSCPMRLFAIEG
jgi:hypothetical protein